MTKRLLVAVLVLALAILAGIVAGCAGGLPGDAVAKVGDTLILKSDFDQRVQSFAAQYQVPSESEDPEGWAQFQKDVLDYMVTYEIASREAAKDNITVTDAEVQSQIDDIVNQYYGGDNSAFTQDLQTYNMTLDQVKTTYRESLLLQKVYDQVTKDVTVSDADVTNYYNNNKSQYFQDETRNVRHILIKPGAPVLNSTTTTTAAGSDSSTAESTTTTTESTTTTAQPTDADWAAALATAQEVRQMLVDGGDWTKLAAEYSKDTSTANNGGDLGVVSKGDMVQEFEDAVFSLKLNEISQPVKTVYGYHIIQVTAINPAVQQTLDEVKADITTTLTNNAKTAAWNKWVADQKQQLGVIYAAGLAPTTTTTAAPTNISTESTSATSGEDLTTPVSGDTTATSAGETITTSSPAVTAEPAGDTPTTAAP